MKYVKYTSGFLLGLFRVLFGLLEHVAVTIYEIPESCHLFGKLCYITNKFPHEITIEEILVAQEKHLEDCDED